MNYLGHLYVTRYRPELMAGVFLGDHVKGTLKGDRERDIELGIRFHRAVDAHVDQHDVQLRSIRRLPQAFRRFGGIVCDVTYDHFLARHWLNFHSSSLDDFARTAYQQVLAREAVLGKQPAAMIHNMAQRGSLQGYGDKSYLQRSFQFLSERLSFENPLAKTPALIEQLEPELEADFLEFLPEVDEFAQNWLLTNAEPQRY